MSRFLIVTGLVFVAAGILWPWLTRLGLGHLPGDVVVHRGHTTIYIPIVTCLVVSVVLTLLLWFFRR